MNTKTRNKTDLTAYLLGNLTGDEAELFDELSFTDDEFEAELSAVEKDLVDSFIRGELRGKALLQFETYYLASPLRREKVEFARAFQEFAEKELADEKPVIFPAGAEKPKHDLRGILAYFLTIPRISLQWGFALAAFGLLIFGGWYYLENARLRTELSQNQTGRDEMLKREIELQQREKQLLDEVTNQRTQNSETEKELAQIREERKKLELDLNEQNTREQQRLREQRIKLQKQTASTPNRPISIASFILTPALRGGNEIQTLAIAPGTTSVKMRLELEADEFPAYRVRLRNQSGGQIIWQSGKLMTKKSGANNFLIVNFSAALLKSQIYTLEVSGQSQNGTAENFSDYSFRIVR